VTVELLILAMTAAAAVGKLLLTPPSRPDDAADIGHVPD